jgi:uncharacterized protein YbjT (DUF2867 family)
MARLAVTGANGFMGQHVLALLLSEGHEVRGLDRSQDQISGLNGSAKWHRGDVRDPDTVRSLVRGCDMVIHLAGGFSGADDLVEIVTTGTRTIAAVAREENIQRLVYMSCLGADAAARSPFYAAKWRAEQLVRSSGVPHVILRPSLVLGPDDGVTRPLAQLIRSLPAVPVPGRGQHREQPIDVEDLARCVTRALTLGELTDQTVSVGGPIFVTLRQLVDLIAGELGVMKPKILLPYRSLPSAARLIPAAGRPLFQQPRLGQFQHGVVASPGIVQRMFGFEARSILSRLPEYLS